MKAATIIKIFYYVCFVTESHVLSILFEVTDKRSEGPWDEEDHVRVTNENMCGKLAHSGCTPVFE